MEELIIHTISMSRQGEIRHFEIPLSKNAKRITGLWYKIRLMDTPSAADPVLIVLRLTSKSSYQPEVMVGKLSLSSNQREGVFYYGNLILQDMNQSYLDYTTGVFRVTPQTHADFSKNLEVNIDANTAIVHGFIHDQWGVLSGRNIRYEVDIYLYQALNDGKLKTDNQ